jgi:hypothetical protein
MFLSLFVLGFIGYYNKEDRGIVGFFGRLFNKTNHFNVVYANVNPKQIDIVWLSEYGVSDTLVKDGEIKDNINYDYGKESFIVLFKDSVLCSDGFFSTNNNDPHDVEIKINKTCTGFEVLYKIDNTVQLK